MPTFTVDWFTHIADNFVHIRENLESVDSILEIGCNEGRSTCWMLENMLSLTGTITCIDPFANTHINPFNPEKVTEDRTTENRFRSNVAEAKKAKQKINIMPELSYTGLAKLIVKGQQYDFIYVDGNHTAEPALTDACMCWGLLKPGGVMLFDDYLWEDEADHFDRCKMSIDAFTTLFRRQFKFIVLNYQLGVQKL
jgi:predicted O-methyltransferase YrrM